MLPSPQPNAEVVVRWSGALVEDVDGFCAVTETNKATWPIPVLPVPFENNNKDLEAYVEAHQDALGLDVEALRPLDRMERKLILRVWTMIQRRRSREERTARKTRSWIYSKISAL